MFSVGDKISVDELSKLTKEKDLELITKSLRQLRDKYQKSDSPIALHEENNNWKMNVREEHLSTIRKVVKKMELSKTLLETLAVIAWKAPVLQSIVIKVRTNKAYDHLDELEKRGYITRKKHGRTKLINLTQKFFEYFEINKKGGLGRIFKRVTKRAKEKYGDIVEEEPTEEAAESPSSEIKEPDTFDVKEEIKIVDEDKTGEKVDELEVYKEKPEIEIVDEERKDSDSDEVILGGKKLTPENIEKLKKAKELIEDK